MRAEILSVGTELLLGDIVNTNAQFLSQQLAMLGYNVFYQTVVGDNAQRLKHVVLEAKERSDVIVISGGLGPTEDDLTKETVAEAFGDILIPDAEELAKIEDLFKSRGWTMTANNRKQAMVPRLGKKLPNANGTAPGAYFRQGGKYAILLPGPPHEMQAMFMAEALPILESMQDSVLHSLTLRVIGIGESELEEKVKTLLASPNPTAALYAKLGEVHIRITAKAPLVKQAELMCEEYARMFRKLLGPLIYSTGEDLETTVVGLLIENGQTLATAESCTGGLLGQRITSVTGASAVYGYGAVTYANEAKHEMLGVSNATLRKNGAVSGQVAAEMAFGAAKLANADYGVAITGIAGPNGGSVQKPVGLVYAAVASGRDVYVKKINAPNRGREFVRNYAAQNTLDMLRRTILELPIAGAKHFTKSQQANFERVGKPRRKGGAFARAVFSMLLVIVLIALLVVGVWLSSRSPEYSSRSQTLSGQGMVYGSGEYNTAALALLEKEMQVNPAVIGFVAMPGILEQTVAKASTSGQLALNNALKEPGVNGMPVLGTDAVPGRTGGNTLVLGDASFAPLLGFADVGLQPHISTFTYYTQLGTLVYRVFAVYYAEDDEAMLDGFAPKALSVTDDRGFITFAVGAKARSLYDIPVDISQTDSYMTLAANDPNKEGRHLYVCGRLVREGEINRDAAVSAVAKPLMPASFYATRGEFFKIAEENLQAWTAWYLSRDVQNSDLQLMLGMPSEDKMPLVGVPRPTYDEQELITSQPESVPGENDGQVESLSESVGSGSYQESFAQSGSIVSDNLQSTSVPESSASVQSSESAADTPAPAPMRPNPHMLTVTMNGVIVTDSTTKILAQICQGELEGQDPEAMKALAIAAHSWILNMQGAGVEAPHVTGRPASTAAMNATAQVANMLLSGDGENPAFTPWFTAGAFGTNTPQNVFGAEREYLQSVPSAHDEGAQNWRQIISVPMQDFADMAMQSLGVDLYVEELPEQWFSEVEKNEAGYVQNLTLGGQSITGYMFYKQVLVQNGVPMLASTAFEVQFDGEEFVFINYGRGHGCGLSVTGASGYAGEGWGYERILQHYYPGAEIIDNS